MALFRKDASLNYLADSYNVAQFVSFAPEAGEPVQQYSRVVGYEANHIFHNLNDAIISLLKESGSGTVNIRSFTATETQSREFIYGLSEISTIAEHIRRLTNEGAFTILNETIDVSDGGVSGVAMGDVVEFRPDATPRGVEKPGFVSLPRQWAKSLIKIVYGLDMDFPTDELTRVEFSIHPARCGWRKSHTIYWEAEPLQILPQVTSHLSWPNDFSRIMGDKAFGLLVAWLCDVKVPYTTVIGRRLAPFYFGTPTGTAEVWTRTCPSEQVPGKYTTVAGWVDPFRLISFEDPSHSSIASILSQHSVDSEWSGAMLEGADGEFIIEGVEGFGDRFMQGEVSPQQLPLDVIVKVNGIAKSLREKIGSIRFEWAYDGYEVWILQLHLGRSSSTSTIIVPGEAKAWNTFKVSDGLEELRQLLSRLSPTEGILLDGNVGITSHIADVVRRAGVPTRVKF